MGPRFVLQGWLNPSNDQGYSQCFLRRVFATYVKGLNPQVEGNHHHIGSLASGPKFGLPRDSASAQIGTKTNWPRRCEKQTAKKKACLCRSPRMSGYPCITRCVWGSSFIQCNKHGAPKVAHPCWNLKSEVGTDYPPSPLNGHCVQGPPCQVPC